MDADLDSWNKAAEAWDSRIAKDGAYRTLLINDALDKLLPDVNGQAALDVGCGNGYYSDWLSKKGAKVKGVDGAVEMVRIASEKHPAIDFQVQDARKRFPDPDESYDLILANMLLMHVSDISLLLSEARRLLRPNGRLVFSVLHPAFNYPTARLYKTLWQKLAGSRPNLLSEDYLATGQGRFESHMGQSLTHYHRTLEKYSQELAQARLVIRQLLEPHQLPESFLAGHPQMEYAQRFPRFIFFDCTKS